MALQPFATMQQTPSPGVATMQPLQSIGSTPIPKNDPFLNPGGISPMAQSAIDAINKQVAYYSNLNASNAKALSLQRGQAGSSTEQFGVQQALAQTQQAGLSQITPILTQGMNLSSDELASLRNMGMFQQQLQLQQQLGNAGINLGQQNLSQAGKLGQQTGQNQLIGALAPLLLGGGGLYGMGGGGAGGLGNLFSGLSSGAAGGAGPYSATALPGPYAPGAAGSAGGIGAGALPIAGALAGSAMLANYGGKIGTNLGGSTGGIAGSLLANPIGAQINFGKNLLQNPSQTISNAVGGGGHKQDLQGAQGSFDPTLFGTEGNKVRYDSNVKGSAVNDFNKVIQGYTPEQLQQRYAAVAQTGNTSMLGTDLDRQNYAKYLAGATGSPF